MAIVLALILITGYFLLPSTIISAPIKSNALTSKNTSLWPNNGLENLPWYSQSIATNHNVLPNRVFIIGNHELVTLIPSIPISHIESTVENSGSENVTIASVIILPSRQIVVGDNDKITEVWSNTSGMDYGFYSLSVWQEKLNGTEHHMTQEILSQYNKLVKQIDWNKMGRVY